MNRFIYNVFIYLATPFIFIYLLYRGLNSKDYRNRLSERFGYIKLTFSSPVIFIHSVSMGETIAAIPLINQLLDTYPNHTILVTTSTPTGREVVKKNFCDRVAHCYLPIDLPGAIKRFLTRINPQIAIVMETELWPNLIHQLHQRQVPILLANARMSCKSMQGYLSKAAPLMRDMLSKLDRVSAQFESDGQRFLTLGLPQHKLVIGGSIKFELVIDKQLQQQQVQLKEHWAKDRLVWVAGSTHPGENEQILAAHQALIKQFPNLLLILVPRHSERFNEVAHQAQAAGFNIIRRSLQQPPKSQCQVVIGDTMGEMLLLLGIADITYIGGSLIERGGHNPLEPAALGKPVIMGPSCYNFSDINLALKDAGGLMTVANHQQLSTLVANLLNHPQQRLEMGASALQVVQKNTGTLKQLMEWTSIYINEDI